MPGIRLWPSLCMTALGKGITSSPVLEKGVQSVPLPTVVTSWCLADGCQTFISAQASAGSQGCSGLCGCKSSPGNICPSTQGSLKYLHFSRRSSRNPTGKGSLLARQMSIDYFGLLNITFAVENWPWDCTMVLMAFQGWAVLLPLHSTCCWGSVGLARHRDMQHLAERLRRSLQHPGCWLTFRENLSACSMCPERCIDVTLLGAGQASKGQWVG